MTVIRHRRGLRSTYCGAIAAALLGLADAQRGTAAIVSDFEDLPLEAGAAWNGETLAGGFQSRAVHYANVYTPEYASWVGFAYSSVNDTNTPGYGNQYAVISGTGVGGEGNYTVAFDASWQEADIVTFPVPSCVSGFFVNNTTYTALTIRDGDGFGFAKPFGGISGNDPDWFRLTVTGRDAAGGDLGNVDVYLADYRFTNNLQDTIVTDWTWVDLTTFGPGVKTLHFALSSSDSGVLGMNTPAYFAMDALTFTPQPAAQAVADLQDVLLPAATNYWNGSDGAGGFWSGAARFGNIYTALYDSWVGFAVSAVDDTTTPGYGNQYAVISGTGVGGDGHYAVGFDASWEEADIITLPALALVKGCYLNNTTYAALDMRDGGPYGFSKQFGGPSGNDPDWFRLTITGRDSAGTALGSVDFYLADYRFADNAQDTIITNWTWVDLSGIGPGVKSLHFALASTDNGAFGMNTPAYFALDDLQYAFSYSGPADDAGLFDPAIPGFTGPDGAGDTLGGSNTVNPAFAGWAASVAAYAPIAGLSPEWTNATRVLGPASADPADVVSLGELSAAQIASNVAPGSLTLGFDIAIADEEGPDLAIFENGLLNGLSGMLFGELAYVEVSSDGATFARFPSATIDTNAIAQYGAVRSELLYNLAGKHANGYGHSWGTPFDLSDLRCAPAVTNGSVDLDHIRYIRIIDIPGTGDYTDAAMPPNPIHDPWQTFGSGGIDIEAVGVLNSPSTHRVLARAHGPGRVSPTGAPDGLIAVPDGSNLVVRLDPFPGYVLIDVAVNGVSVGPTQNWTFVAVNGNQRLDARFGTQLTVRSDRGTPTPDRGTRLDYGTVRATLADSPVTVGTTQYVCIGWVGTGSVPASGSTTDTGVFMLTNSSVLTWTWATNVWVDPAAGYGGRVTREADWAAFGSTVAVTAAPDSYFTFAGWSGDVQGDTNATELVLAMDRARAITAHFHAPLTIHNVPEGWLAANGLTNDTSGAEELRDDDEDGSKAWQEFFGGTDPNDGNSRFAVLDAGALDGSNYVTWVAGTNGSTAPFRVLAAPFPGSPWTTIAPAVPRAPGPTNVWWGPWNASNQYFRVGVPTGL